MSDKELIKKMNIQNDITYRCKTNAVVLDLWVRCDGETLLSSRDLINWKKMSEMIKLSILDKWIILFVI